jgi:hypothetical protein
VIANVSIVAADQNHAVGVDQVLELGLQKLGEFLLV